ncbi:MAG: hypothetical protein LJE83_05900 [Gammaproteobacteria bacterium]|nr:hypothetical protein [Gammaproteobacteria bacterium]
MVSETKRYPTFATLARQMPDYAIANPAYGAVNYGASINNTNKNGSHKGCR